MPRRKIKKSPTKRLSPDPSGQEQMFEKCLEEELEAKKNAPVECLGRGQNAQWRKTDKWKLGNTQ